MAHAILTRPIPEDGRPLTSAEKRHLRKRAFSCPNEITVRRAMPTTEWRGVVCPTNATGPVIVERHWPE